MGFLYRVSTDRQCRSFCYTGALLVNAIVNSKITLGAIAILLIVGGGYVIATSKKTTDTKVASTTASPTTTPSATTESSPKAAGIFTDYDSAKLANASTSDVVLFFSAPWCPTCKEANIAFNANTPPGGLTLLKVDYDSATELKKKYGVTYQHTFVQVDASGNLIKKWSGSTSYAELTTQTN